MYANERCELCAYLVAVHMFFCIAVRLMLFRRWFLNYWSCPLLESVFWIKNVSFTFVFVTVLLSAWFNNYYY